MQTDTRALSLLPANDRKTVCDIRAEQLWRASDAAWSSINSIETLCKWLELRTRAAMLTLVSLLLQLDPNSTHQAFQETLAKTLYKVVSKPLSGAILSVFAFGGLIWPLSTGVHVAWVTVGAYAAVAFFTAVSMAAAGLRGEPFLESLRNEIALIPKK